MGVGSLAVELARWRGSRVLATASASHAEFVRSLGAEEVIDYRSTRFEETLRDIDVVLDTIGGETQERSWQVLRKGGVLVALDSFADSARRRRATRRARCIFHRYRESRTTGSNLEARGDEGKLRPVIAEVLPLARAREAFEHGAGVHSPGTIVLRASAA